MDIKLFQPSAEDGYNVSQLIARCPPLDTNSTYCNLLQCHHFSDTCVIAKSGEDVVGFVSGYVQPANSNTLFVWQVAVDERARGQRLALRMLEELLARPTLNNIEYIETTITPGNQASENLFARLAQQMNIALQKTLQYARQEHFGGQHDDEILHRLGPIPSRS